MSKRSTYIMFVVAAVLILSTACTVQDVPAATETQSVPELSNSNTESPNLTTKTEQDSLPAPKQEPTQTPTPKPTPTPKSTQTTEPSLTDTSPDSNIIAEDPCDKYFSNSVFVGDSVMEGFAQFIRAQRNKGVSVLSNAQFITSVMGVKVADMAGETSGENRRYYTYRGKEQPLETILKEMGVERAFIMLGMNDIGVGYSPDETIERYRKMISLIKETNPDLDLVVMTTTPKTAAKWLPNYIPNKNFGSPLLNELADKLKVMCQEEGIKVVDLNSAVRGPDGHLPNEYSRDNFVHINDKCSVIVLDVLRQFAKTQMEE